MNGDDDREVAVKFKTSTDNRRYIRSVIERMGMDYEEFVIRAARYADENQEQFQRQTSVGRRGKR